MKRNRFLAYKRARCFVRKLGLKNQKEWNDYRKRGNKPPNIPSNPNEHYKNKGWKDWYDWLGTCRRKFAPFKVARQYARNKNIKSQREWIKFRSSNSMPLFIPSAPNATYKNQGWLGWGDWFGTYNTNRKPVKYKVNHNFFKKWSRDVAYVLGLWFADGCILKSGNGGFYFRITLHIKDRYLLLKILQKMKSDYPLSKRQHNCTDIVIRSKKIYNDIIRLGGKERKSLDVKFPSVPKKYLPDFVRGLWDGDGSIFWSKSSDAFESSLVSGSRLFIYKLRNILKNNINGLGGKIYTDVKKKGYKIRGRTIKSDSIIYALRFFTNDTRRLRDYMYRGHNELKMNRKYNLFSKTGKVRLWKYGRKSFLKSRSFARKLHLPDNKSWFRYIKSHVIPEGVPRNPYSAYKNKGWVDWYDWLGKAKNAV